MNILVDSSTRVVLAFGTDVTIANLAAKKATWCDNYDSIAGSVTVVESVPLPYTQGAGTLPVAIMPNDLIYSVGGNWSIVSGHEAIVAAQIVEEKRAATFLDTDITVDAGILADGVTTVSFTVTINHVATATRYQLKVSTTSGGTSVFTSEFPDSGSATTIQKFNNLLPNTTYYFQLRAITAWGYSDWTSEVSKTTATVLANSVLSEMINDDKLQPPEKATLKPLYDAYVSEQSDLDSKASAWSDSTTVTKKTAYDNAVTTLYNWVVTTKAIFSNMTTTSDLGTGGGATLRGLLHDVQVAKTELQNQITAMSATTATLDSNGILNGSGGKVVDNALVSVGGRNLLQGTFNNAGWGWVNEIDGTNRLFGFTASGNGTGNLGTLPVPAALGMLYMYQETGQLFVYSPSFYLISGETYTLSFWAGSYYVTDATLLRIGQDGSLASVGLELTGVNWGNGTLGAGTWEYHTHTFTSTYTGNCKLVFGHNSNAYLYLHAAMLSRGNVALDWSPAPEDIEAQFTAIASDAVLSKGEKPTVINTWYNINGNGSTTGECWRLLSAASALSLPQTSGTPYDNVVVARQALSDYLTGLSPAYNVTTEDTTIVAVTFKTKFSDYYDAMEVLRKAVSDKAATLAAWSGVTGDGRPASYAGKGTSLYPDMYEWEHIVPSTVVDVTGGPTGTKAIHMTVYSEIYPELYHPIDRTVSTFRIRFWARANDASTGTGLLFFALRQYTDYVGTTGPVNAGLTPYKPGGWTHADVGTNWRLFEYEWGPSDWQTGVVAVRPYCLGNYEPVSGWFEIQGFECFDTTGVQNSVLTPSIEAAQTDATTALTTLGNIASDAAITQGEKQPIFIEWKKLYDEKSGIDTQATNYGITTLKTAYDNYWTTLQSYLNDSPISIQNPPTDGVTWITSATVINITASTFRDNFTNVYTSRQALLNEIARVSGTLSLWNGVTNRPVIFDSYFETPSAWSPSTEDTDITFVASSGSSGGTVMRVAGDHAIFSTECLPVDTSRYYLSRCRARRAGGTGGAFYAGFECFDVNKAHIAPSPDGASYNYAAFEYTNLTSSWTVSYGIINQPVAADDGALHFRTGTAYVRLMMLVNYNGSGSDVTEIDVLEFYDVTEAYNASLTALWSNIAGQTNAPANNATVGATWGTDLNSRPSNLASLAGSEDITNDKLGTGANLISNSDFLNASYDGWLSSLVNSSTIGMNLSNYQLTGSNTLYIYQPNGTTSNSSYIRPNSFVSSAGKKHEFFVYTGAIRCIVSVTIYWYNSGGYYISQSDVFTNDEESAGGLLLTNYKKTGGIVTAPTNTATGMLIVFKGPTKSGQSDSYGFYAHAFVGVAGANQTVLSDWSPATPTVRSLGYTGALDATHNVGALADLNTVATATIDANSVTKIVSSYSDSSVYTTVDNTLTTFISATITRTGAPMLVVISAFIYLPRYSSTVENSLLFSVLEGSNNLWTSNVHVETAVLATDAQHATSFSSHFIIDDSVTGSKTYDLKYLMPVADTYMEGILAKYSITLMECKR